jgi:hypothetical protein
MFRDQKRESDPAVLQETRDDDPHDQDYEKASEKLGGGGNGNGNGIMAPSPSQEAPGARASRARRLQSDTSALEQQMAELTQTVKLLAEQKSMRKSSKKSPPGQKSQASSDEDESEGEYDSSSEDDDPHKAPPLPPTSDRS